MIWRTATLLIVLFFSVAAFAQSVYPPIGPGSVVPLGPSVLAAGVQPIAPNQIAGLALWLVADQNTFSDSGCTIPQTTNGGSVGCWGDLSGLGNNCTQASGTIQPTLETSAVNGHSAISTAVTHSECNSAYLGELGTVLVVYRFKSSSVSTNYTASLMGATTSKTIGAYYLQVEVNNSAIQQFQRAKSTDTTSISYSVTSQRIWNTWDVMGVRNSGSAISLYKQDVQMGSALSTAALLAVGGSAVIGADYYNNALEDWCGCEIAEVIAYPTNVTNAQYAGLALYLQNKYGLGYTGKPYLTSANEGKFLDGQFVALESDGTNFMYRPSNLVPHTGNLCGIPDVMDYNGKTWVLCSQLIINKTGLFNTLDLFSSTDGFNFTYVTTLSFADVVSNASNGEIWGTSFFVDTDGSVHVEAVGSNTANTSPISGYAIYEKTATDLSGLTTWSSTNTITGTSLRNNMIDTDMQKIGLTYYRFYTYLQNTGVENVEVISSSSINSGYAIIESGNWANWGITSGFFQEAPRLLNKGDPNWRIFLDYSPNSPPTLQQSFSDSTTSLPGSAWGTVTTITTPFASPAYMQHIDIIPMPSYTR